MIISIDGGALDKIQYRFMTTSLIILGLEGKFK